MPVRSPPASTTNPTAQKQANPSSAPPLCHPHSSSPRAHRSYPARCYLHLYHGRNDPGQEIDEWGSAGPAFGPLSCYVHTYCSTFRIHGECGAQELWLETHDDMIQWDACFYGDMEVFIAGTGDTA